MTDDEIEGVFAETYERDVSDELFRHFEETHARWDWCEIGDEAVRVHTLATDEPVDDFSFLYGMYNAVAAQAAEGAFAAVAATLGLDAKQLSTVVATWYENKDELPPPISYRTLIRRMEKVAEFLR